ncbi:MAG: hypothetical protein UX82_C0024G0008 [Microgenomates group bacterium GW2011_GWE1_47_12]|uniref:Dockerin domain-containing protein n=2 Tax=Candidatus Collieribacteriota TaxID=1752725 RepID=A0A1F5FZ60_9BACT|nr:MAG: hypothetical protein UX32_C0024G0005 [Microgenomates group bacterium GW2011_GWF1_46_12]KKU27438.1 MAG: hypothetical protein UX40_C0016G0008 [Microgenomates group bacterium GW2011_GWF2_46_18]KKU44620.1 MAG: hypothetical protein UX63_C0028G0005 [Microgenomates group bacterium GW2011_GWB1_46_7]KKU59496.1 MAG: hypothetical protein UX82_C0024G0008 [Microgenomates group bacterium GW2011_GWE1_47_12]KKU62214.1 MAG: hypothetical protein UX84_C0014G0012 [Microgenomates group bacterium GW2011_GWD1
MPKQPFPRFLLPLTIILGFSTLIYLGYRSLVHQATPVSINQVGNIPNDTDSPIPTLYVGEMGFDVSQPAFLDDLVQSNPMYIVFNPYYPQSVPSASVIQDIHTRLPQLKVLLHIFPASLFDQKKLDSPIAKVSFSSQNTQTQFDNAWTNHQDAFLKDASGEYVYNTIDPVGQMWLKEGQGYLMDPAHPFYQNLLYNRIKYLVTELGYDGVYLDIMVIGFMQGMYSSRPALDGFPLTNQQWNDKLISLSQSLQNKRQTDPDPRMRNALIFTNSVGGGKYTVGVVDYNRDLRTQGVQIENPFQDYPDLTTDEWLKAINLIRDISSLRNNQMRGWLLYHLSEGMNSRHQCNQQSLFTYASFLLSKQSPNFAFHYLCKIQDSSLPASERRVVPSETLTRISLDSPVAPYQRLASGLYVREFANGFALVNPTSSSLNYQSNINLHNAYSATTYPKNTNITLPAKTGLVLLKNAPSPSSRPGDLNSDGTINLLDYNLLKSGFGTTYNLLDYNTLRSQWGQ